MFSISSRMKMWYRIILQLCVGNAHLLLRDSQLALQLKPIFLHARREILVPLVHGGAPLHDACGMDVALRHETICQLQQQLYILLSLLSNINNAGEKTSSSS